MPMVVRAVIFAFFTTLVWAGLKHVISEYGSAILAIGTATVLVYLFGRFVGPKLPVYLGGDPPPQQPVESNPEWDLYIAMNSGNLERVKACLESGASPFKTFAPDHRPYTTKARNCYEHAQQTEHLRHLVAIFEATRVGT